MRLLACVCFALTACTNPAQVADGGDDASIGDDAGATPYSVSFAYKPSWPGVTAVAVIGGFGTATDWTQPLITLAPDGNGGFAGTAMLPAGQYLYLFKVTGDAAAGMPSTFSRNAVDPAQPDFAACPMASPSYSKIDVNPCSQVTVPQPPAAARYTVAGRVTLDGNPAPGWLAVLERDEPKSHHYFVDRSDAAADGSFSASLAAGTYRVQLLHPSYLSANDLTLSQTLGNQSRRVLSSTFTVGGEVTLSSAEVAYHDYAQLQPTDVDGGVAMPTLFSFTLVQGAVKARLAIYGGQQPEVGDPWYASTYGTATSDTFDGGFNTMQAAMPSAVPGDRYFWGTWQINDGVDGGVQWTRQSMVIPIHFR
jgi:hypothetical protein